MAVSNLMPIIKSYAALIKAGRKTIEQVPERIRADVAEYLASTQ